MPFAWLSSWALLEKKKKRKEKTSNGVVRPASTAGQGTRHIRDECVVGRVPMLHPKPYKLACPMIPPTTLKIVNQASQVSYHGPCQGKKRGKEPVKRLLRRSLPDR